MVKLAVVLCLLLSAPSLAYCSYDDAVCKLAEKVEGLEQDRDDLRDEVKVLRRELGVLRTDAMRLENELDDLRTKQKRAELLR